MIRSGKLPGYPGTDIKANGGYILWPPSHHPSGDDYERIGTAEIAVLPTRLAEKLEIRWLEPAAAAPNSLEHFLAHPPEGPNSGRHEWAKSVVARLAAKYPNDRARFETECRNAYDLVDSSDFSFEFEFSAIMAWCWAKEQRKGELVASLNTTDLGNAEYLVELYGDDLRYCFQTKSWYVYDNIRWRLDDVGEIYRRATSAVRTLRGDALHQTDQNIRTELLKHAQKSEAFARIQATIALARAHEQVFIRAEDFDRDPMLLCVQNGVLDLTSGKLRVHRREDLITRLSPVVYDPSAKCPLWMEFLRTVFAGDEDLISFVKRAVGYSLTGIATERAMFLAIGNGANGKTVFINIVSDLLGEYAKRAQPETFMKGRRNAISNDIARLAGARFVSTIETEEGEHLAEALLKSMTGGDHMTARFMYREFSEFLPEFKLWIVTNHKPTIGGTDDAIWDRIRLIPFAVRIPEIQRDPDLTEKLRAELPGILNWALPGCLEWQLIGLGEAQAVEEAIAEYRIEQDLLGQFLNECCRRGNDLSVASGFLHSEFSAWLQRTGNRPMASNTFANKMRQKGFTSRRTRRFTVWDGIDLIVDGKPGGPSQGKIL